MTEFEGRLDAWLQAPYENEPCDYCDDEGCVMCDPLGNKVVDHDA